MKVFPKVLCVAILSILLNCVIVRAGYYEFYLDHIPDIILIVMVFLSTVLLYYDSFSSMFMLNLEKLIKNKLFMKYVKDMKLNLVLFNITMISSIITNYYNGNHVDTILFTMSLIFLLLNIPNIIKIHKLITRGNLDEGTS